ncbi:CPBP family intramembrane glutamic endopeptidase [Schaalia dentiphila]|jgi:CAAX amino terminal protease family.|uniref:CAAX amino terminal protease family protein n=1 Tax=Schaalia dentiphila ATCC 17982 TaxID=411466 RepID=A7BEJ0_9ACTO|nr:MULTISPECIES: CPBP family intramembrane glutamic endopeptidase [Schaalia]EDN81614.1 CAAX amino terminal protease family protein [Schaalia odontolytica ATCC 17982]
MFLLSSVISAFVQLGLFLVIPFAWWAFTARRSVGFASWIGLRWPTWDGRRARLGVAILAWVVIGAASTALLQSLSGDVPAARFAGRGLGGLVPVLLFAIVQTSLAEELFFRGFLGKRVIARWGFAPGNAAQAIAFGILHVAMFASFANPIRLLAIGILTGASGWIVGWLNEEGAGGSILPGWTLHASANLLVGTAAAFNLMG